MCLLVEIALALVILYFAALLLFKVIGFLCIGAFIAFMLVLNVFLYFSPFVLESKFLCAARDVLFYVFIGYMLFVTLPAHNKKFDKKIKKDNEFLL
jgi:hypothetical protein